MISATSPPPPLHRQKQRPMDHCPLSDTTFISPHSIFPTANPIPDPIHTNAHVSGVPRPNTPMLCSQAIPPPADIDGIPPPRDRAWADIMPAAVDPAAIPVAVKPRHETRPEARYGVAIADDSVTVAVFIGYKVVRFKYNCNYKYHKQYIISFTVYASVISA